MQKELMHYTHIHPSRRKEDEIKCWSIDFISNQYVIILYFDEDICVANEYMSIKRELSELTNSKWFHASYHNYIKFKIILYYSQHSMNGM